MLQRGRKSADALAINVNDPVIGERPEAPDGMPDDQKAVWEQVIQSCPPDWFPPETLDLLTQYCVHVCRARLLAQGVNDLSRIQGRTPEETKLMYDLMRQEHRQSRMIASLATKMRIAQQSTYDKSRKRGQRAASTATKPWATDTN